MNTGRKYIPQEIQALRAHNHNNQNVIFSDTDFEELAAGTARLKVQHQADKALDEIKRHMQLPMGRRESYQIFLPRQEFNQQFGQLHDRVLFITKTLIKKGILTEADITLTAHEEIAGTWPHLCERCKNIFAECDGKWGDIEPKFANSIFPDLTGALADKVVECSGFTQKPVEEQTEPVKTEDVQKEEVAEGESEEKK